MSKDKNGKEMPSSTDEASAPKTVESLELENTSLKEQLRAAELCAAAAEMAANIVKAAAPKGAKFAKAKMALLGTGRREIKPGDAVNDDELVGLTEGVHFEFGTA